MNLPFKGFRSAGARAILEALFLLWTLVVNFLYYLQFKANFVSRLQRFLHR